MRSKQEKPWKFWQSVIAPTLRQRLLCFDAKANKAVREELAKHLEREEVVVFSGFVPGHDKRPANPLFVSIASFFAIGSLFFLIIAIAIFTGMKQHDPILTIFTNCCIPLALLVALGMRIKDTHARRVKEAAETTVIITDRRAFYAPPAEVIQTQGWGGPRYDSVVWFSSLIQAEKNVLPNTSRIIFPYISTDSEHGSSISHKLLRVVELDEAFNCLPDYLRTQEFAPIRAGESHEAMLERANDILQIRDKRFGLKKTPKKRLPLD